MQSIPTFPTLAEFLSAPLESIRPLAPATMTFAAGGTRREAALAGISPDNDEFVRHAHRLMFDGFEVIFTHGVHHLLAPVLLPEQWQETTPGYRQSLVAWIEWGASGKESLACYDRLGWRARLLGAESIPELEDATQRLKKETNPDPRAPTLWFTVAPTETCFWEHFLKAVPQSGANSQQEAIRALYGEDIPPVELFLGYGKPFVSPPVLPPLLIGHMQCYWKQQPGYRLSSDDFRTILYDYAFTRKTWRQDKTGRAETARAHADVWQKAPTLGLGVRLGPFWYPAPVTPVPEVWAEERGSA
ncbi:MAG: hypothetical protein ACOYYS_14845 [Chloroflexota bacterium]